MGNEQSNNKYRKETRGTVATTRQRQRQQDLDSSFTSSSYYQNKKPVQKPQHMFQRNEINDMGTSRRNNLDISQSRANRNKSSNIRSQVSFEDQGSRSANRSLSPNRSQLLIQSMRDIDRKQFRKRNQVQREEKLDTIRKATDFCVETLMGSIDYDSSSYINSLPILTAMVSSQNMGGSDRNGDDASTIKNIIKNKTLEEQHLRLQMKRYHPFLKEDRNRFSKLNSEFIDDKYDRHCDRQQEQAASLLQSKPFTTFSRNHDNDNLITLDPFEKEMSISEIKPPNRQTFKPLVNTTQNKEQEDSSPRINIKDLITADQQLSSTTGRKSFLGAKNEEQNGNPFSNLFANSIAPEQKESKPKDEYIGIMPVKTNAEVLEDKSGKSLLVQSNQYEPPPPIIKKTIEINERIIESTIPNNPNYNSNLNNSQLNSRPPAAPKNQINNYDPNYQQSAYQPPQNYQTEQTRFEYNNQETSYISQPLRGGFENQEDPNNRSYNRSVSPNASAIQQKGPSNNFYPTTQKLQIKVKKVEIPENSDSSKYDTPSESEDELSYSSKKKGMRLREYEKQRSDKKSKLRSQNNLNTTNQSQLNNSYNNINPNTNSSFQNNNRSNTPSYRNTNYNNTTTVNNSYVTYQPDQSPQNIQQTPQSRYPFNQQQQGQQQYQQPPSQFTVHQVENNHYNPNAYNNERQYDDQEDPIKRGKFQNGRNNNPGDMQTQQQQIFNSNTAQINQQMYNNSQNPNYNNNNNNFSNNTPRQPSNQIENSFKYSNTQQTFSPQFSQQYPNNPQQQQPPYYDQRDYTPKSTPLHNPDQNQRFNNSNIQNAVQRNPDQMNQQMPTTPRSNRQPIFSNHSSQQNSIQVTQQRQYPENNNNPYFQQPQQPILTKNTQNPQNYEKVIDIKVNESRIETKNPAPTSPINQSQQQRDNSFNQPTTSQILNQSYSSINLNQRNQQNINQPQPPPSYRNDNQTEKITTTTTIYQHGVEPNRNPNNQYNNYEQPNNNYNTNNNNNYDRFDQPNQNIYEIAPQQAYQGERKQQYQQPQAPYQNQQQQQPTYQKQQQQPYYQQQQQLPQPQYNNTTISTSKFNQTTYTSKQTTQLQEDGTNVFIVDSPPQSQREIARKRSLNNSRASSAKKKQRKKTPGRKQNQQRSDYTSEEASPNSSVYHEENDEERKDDFSDDENFQRDVNRTNQSQRKSSKNKSNTSYRQSNRNNVNESNYSNKNNGYYNTNGNPNDFENDVEQPKKSRKGDKNQDPNTSYHPYDQSKIIRTDVQQIQQLYQSTQEEQEQPPYDNYYDNKTQQNPNKIRYNNNRDPQEQIRKPQKNSIKNGKPSQNHTYQQESETEEDDLQQQPLSANNFYRQPSGSQKPINNYPQQNYDQYQTQPYPSSRNQPDNLNQSQSSRRQNNQNMHQDRQEYPPNSNPNPNFRQQQQQNNQPMNYPQQQNGQRQQVNPKNSSNQYSQRTDNTQNNNTYHHGSDSDTDQGYPHQDIDKHVYPGNKSLSQSQIKKSQQNQNRILPQNINEDQPYLQYPSQQEYSSHKQRPNLQKQQSEAILNTKNYQDNQRQNVLQQQQNNSYINNTFQPVNSNNSMNNQYNQPQYQQQQQPFPYNQNNNEGRQLQKVQSDANFLRNNNNGPNDQYNQYQQPQQQLPPNNLQNSNIPKVLMNSKVKVKLPQNQNIQPILQNNPGQSKVKQQMPPQQEQQQQQQQYQQQPNQGNRQSNHSYNGRNNQPQNYYEDQDEDENQVLRMTLDLSNQNHTNPQNRTSHTIDFNDNEFNDEPVKVQLTLDEIIKRDDSGFLDNQDDLLNSDASSQQANYMNALNQNLQYQNKYIL